MTTSFAEALSRALRDCPTAGEAVDRCRAVLEQFIVDELLASDFVVNDDVLRDKLEDVDHIVADFRDFLRNGLGGTGGSKHDA